MKQETIGAKGTVPGFRPLIGKERWHRSDFTAEMLDGKRPLLDGERGGWVTQCLLGDKWLTWNVVKYSGTVCQVSYFRTSEPLPPPAVETFEAHGHIWYKHTPGDECPVEPDVKVDILWRCELPRKTYNSATSPAGDVDWDKKGQLKDQELIGYRFPDYPAVHTTSQQEHHVEKTEQNFQHCDQLKQQLTSIYNGWVHLPPETVAECIADVASVLYPTDAERCEAAFQRWWDGRDNFMASKTVSKASWHAAWKAAKESK